MRAVPVDHQPKDHPKGPVGRRQVDLQALRQDRSVGSFLFGEAQLPHRDSLAFVAVARQAGNGDPRDVGVREVLLEDAIVKADGSMGGAWCIWCL
jgi:hypothetical protein